MRRRQKIPLCDWPPLRARPFETVHVHDDLAAEQATQRRVMPHPDVHEKKDLVAARCKGVNDGEECRDESGEILSAWRRNIHETHTAILRHTHFWRKRSSPAVHHDIVPHLREPWSNLPESGLETSEVQLRHRHAVQPEHSDPKRFRRFGSPAHVSITDPGFTCL